MLYFYRIKKDSNTARAKHIRSLIRANKNLNKPIDFIFYNFKDPFKNLFKFIFKILHNFFKKEIIYTRDIDFVIIASLMGMKVIYEIHQLGNLRSSTRNFYINRFIFLNLSRNKNIKFVTLTEGCARVLRLLYPAIKKERIFIIPDAGGFSNINLVQSNKVKNGNSLIKISYAGSFFPGKGGLETLSLARKLKNFEFNIAGNLDIKIIKKISKIENVKFFGYLNDADLIKFYNESDILIAPIGKRIFLDKKLKNEITFYTSPLKLYEYISTNKPIITIDRPCTRIFKAIPGIWFVEKEKEYSSRAWLEIINEIYKFTESNRIDNLYELRNESIYNWDKRIKDMIKIR